MDEQKTSCSDRQSLIVRLKQGLYDGSDIMRAWCMLRQDGERITELEQEVERLKAFREAVVGWRENDWPEYFCRRTAEMVADRGREAEDAGMNEQKTGWHKLNYHERGERITELEARLNRLVERLSEDCIYWANAQPSEKGIWYADQLQKAIAEAEMEEFMDKLEAGQ